MKILFFASLLWSTVHQNYGQESECRTPDLGVGICKPLIECTDLVEKAYKIKKDLVPKSEQKTIRTELSQRKVVCRDDANNKYCCSNCITPDGRSGIITKISDCPSLYKLAVDKKNIEYLRKSRVGNTKTFCCGGTSVEMPTPSKSKCDELIGTPPDPESGCCGIDSSVGSRIVGGTTTAIDEYPWTVLLEYYSLGKEYQKLFAGGSLITKRHVLTAAHCVRPYAPGTVRVGDYDTANAGRDCADLPDGSMECTEGAISIPVKSILSHPEYNARTKHNDIALITLKTAVQYTAFVRPICLPSAETMRTQEPRSLIATGWGKVNYTHTSRYKQAVRLSLVDEQKCQMRITRKPIWEGQICAGGVRGKDTCQGDSGGPLMLEVTSGTGHYELAGLVSYGAMPCGAPDIPGVYTRVHHYIDWIKQNVL